VVRFYCQCLNRRCGMLRGTESTPGRFGGDFQATADCQNGRKVLAAAAGGARCPELRVPGFDAQCYSLTTFSAWRPLGPFVTPNSTLSPSFRDLKPEAWMDE
jgi:hypothetical protein